MKSGLNMDDNSWKTTQFRQNVISKIEDAIHSSGVPTVKSSAEMESHVFQKSKNRDEYLSFVAKLILHIREVNTNKKVPAANNAQIPQNNQNIPDPINALRNLAHQGSGNQGMGVSPQGIQHVTASGLLQTLNQRPNLQNKLHPPQPNMMSQLQQGQMPPGSVGNQLTGGASHMNANLNSVMGNANNLPTSMSNQMGPMLMPQISNAGTNSAQNQIITSATNVQISNSMSQASVTGPMPNQMSHMVQRKPENIIPQGPANNFIGQRGPIPQNQFVRQNTPPSPSPVASISSVPGNIVPSPALVPSPSAAAAAAAAAGQLTSAPGSIRPPVSNMVPSPSSVVSLNTPSSVQPIASPSNEDQAYREKVRQLSKYIEPLRRMIAGIGNDDKEKLSKMKKLLEILSTPGQRMPLETLLKCEIVLEKMDFKKVDGTGSSGSTSMREQHPLLEAVSIVLQSPYAHHTLHRTFGPVLEVLCGPPIKSLPRPLKRRRMDDTSDDIPEVLQGEIARLDQRFKVSLDPKHQNGSKSIHLSCWLDDRHLPCVPPIEIIVPEDYPSTPPACEMSQFEYGATDFLTAVQKALKARNSMLPIKYSVSQLLDNWEMSVRQACKPSNQLMSSYY